MTLPGGLLDTTWIAVGWVLAGVALLAAGRELATKIRPRHFGNPLLFSPWLGSIVALAILWQLEIRTEQGIVIHLLGSSLFAVMFGPARALTGLLLVTLAVTANGHGEWSMLGPNLVSNAMLPICIVWLAQQGVRRWLPEHLFVFVFANGFFAGALTLFLTGLGVMLLVLAGSSAPIEPERFIDGWLPPVLLLSFSEAWLSGMILTLLVIYRPEWVVSFDRRLQARKP
jgi:uncharacterized membrane protein